MHLMSAILECCCCLGCKVPQSLDGSSNRGYQGIWYKTEGSRGLGSAHAGLSSDGCVLQQHELGGAVQRHNNFTSCLKHPSHTNLAL